MSRLRKDPLQDLKDFLQILNKKKISYVIVGAHAMSFWGYVRATGDLDVLVLPNQSNAKRLLEALKEFGAPVANLSEQDFTKEEQVLQLGVSPIRIDILTSITGVKSSEAFRSSRKAEILGISVRVLSLKHLIKNKQALDRPKDRLDTLELKKLNKKS